MTVSNDMGKTFGSFINLLKKDMLDKPNCSKHDR